MKAKNKKPPNGKVIGDETKNLPKGGLDELHWLRFSQIHQLCSMIPNDHPLRPADAAKDFFLQDLQKFDLDRLGDGPDLVENLYLLTLMVSKPHHPPKN